MDNKKGWIFAGISGAIIAALIAVYSLNDTKDSPIRQNPRQPSRAQDAHQPDHGKAPKSEPNPHSTSRLDETGSKPNDRDSATRLLKSARELALIDPDTTSPEQSEKMVSLETGLLDGLKKNSAMDVLRLAQQIKAKIIPEVVLEAWESKTEGIDKWDAKEIQALQELYLLHVPDIHEVARRRDYLGFGVALDSDKTPDFSRAYFELIKEQFKRDIKGREELLQFSGRLEMQKQLVSDSLNDADPASRNDARKRFALLASSGDLPLLQSIFGVNDPGTDLSLAQSMIDIASRDNKEKGDDTTMTAVSNAISSYVAGHPNDEVSGKMLGELRSQNSGRQVPCRH